MIQRIIIGIKEIDWILGVISGPGESKTAEQEHVDTTALQMHLIVGSLPKIGEQPDKL